MAEIDFYIDFQEASSVLAHSWEHSVGSCHALMALREDWRQQLTLAHKELGFQYVRFHGLLSDDVGPLIIQNKKPLFSFFNLDSIVDFLLKIGMKPLIELSFMPEGIASGRKTVFHYRGNITPPRHYKDWEELVSKLVRHCVKRYGVTEVRKWMFEVWNEPNLKAFWTGSKMDYFSLYRHTVTVIKEIDSRLHVGGPATANNAWIDDFREFCEKEEIDLDFISTHHYPTDAFGKPDDDTETQLSLSRRSVLREQVEDSRRKAGKLPLYYTEWNTSSNPRDLLHDLPYAAAFVAKSAIEADPFVDGYSFWTFSDIFEENYFPSIPFHGGFGLLNLHGIRKPAYRAFEMLHRCGKKRFHVDGIHETVDCGAFQSENQTQIMLTNHAYPKWPIDNQNVTVHLKNSMTPKSAWVEKIDETSGNPYIKWKKIGSPEYLSESQIQLLHNASEIRKEELRWKIKSDELQLQMRLSPHSVALLILQN